MFKDDDLIGNFSFNSKFKLIEKSDSQSMLVDLIPDHFDKNKPEVPKEGLTEEEIEKLKLQKVYDDLK